jgi:hypothetical protein
MLMFVRMINCWWAKRYRGGGKEEDNNCIPSFSPI